MRRFTAIAIVGLFIAAAPALAQQAGTRTADENPPARVEAPPRGCGFLGVYPADISRRTAEKLRLAERRGAIVAGIVRQTGAERAGIREKDVITGFNGESIGSEGQLRRLIMAQMPGSWVRIDLIRDGSPMTVNAEISSRARFIGGPDCNAQQSPEREQLEQRQRDAVKDLDISHLDLGRFESEVRMAQKELEKARSEVRRSVSEVRVQREMASGYEGTTGLGLQRISDQLAQYFRTGTSSGALVNDVADGSPALRAGMQAGDVIVEVNGAVVSGPMDAVRAIVRDRDGSVDLLIVREGRRQTVTVRTGSRDVPSHKAPAPTAPETAPDLGVRSHSELMRLAGGVENLQ